MTAVSTLLPAFKLKIEEAVALVPTMMAEEKLKAVQFWNVVSERLQEIVNNSAADISALAFEMEKQQDASKNAPNKDILHPTVRQGGPEESLPTNLVQGDAASEASQELAAPIAGQPPQLPFRMDLAPSIESPLTSGIEAAASETIPASVPMASVAVPALPSFSPAVSSSLTDPPPPTLIAPPSGTLLLMASTIIPSGQDAIVLNDTSRSSRLQELLSRPLGSGSAAVGSSSKVTTPGKSKRGNTGKWEAAACNSWRDEQSEKSSSSTVLNARKPQAKNNRKKKPAVQRFEPGFNATAQDGAEVTEGDSVLRSIKVESVDDVNEDSQQTYKENGMCEGRLKAGEIHSGLDAGDGVDEEEDLEEDDDDVEGDDGCFDGDVEEVEEIGLDPVTDQDGKKVYTCTYCQKTYANASAYKAHRYSHTKPYSCTECHARFTTRGNLVVHVRRHTGEKPYGCVQCKAKFSTKGNLKRHIRSHSGERPWECGQCGGRFTEKKSLTVHMRRHTGERPYQCTICGKQFAQTGILQTHMSMHMDQREHLCEHCGKSFRQKSQLRLHMLRHQGVRKYNCDQCEAKFLTKGDLERHNRMHTGERPFVCEMCGKTFTRQQSLNEHMNRHYGLKPYQCKYCGKGFAEMSACYKHIKQHERLAKQKNARLPAVAPSKRNSVSNQHLLSNTPSVTLAPSEQLALVDEEENDVEGESAQKFTVLVRTDDDALDVGSEISVVQHEHSEPVLPNEPEITVAVSQNLGDFTAISLLANASTTFQENF